MTTRNSLRAICSLLLLALLPGCSVPFRSGEVARVASPSGRVDAIVIEANTGRASASSYDVFIVPSGEGHARGRHVASLYSATRNRSSYGVNLKWENSARLAIEYLKASAAKVLEERPAVEGEQVEVWLRDGVEDVQAPPGIMLDNLHKKR
ncbi:MAG TPA: hypothetical protein VJQ56_04320 [Blastocatellia bacterium]|nr:hypothetical protein [Blastocatellia bacterium]